MQQQLLCLHKVGGVAMLHTQKPCIAHEWSECSCPSTSLASYLIHTAHVEARSYSATGATGDEEEVKLDASSNGERGQHLH